MLLPTDGDITIVPTLSYSMLTRDDELQLSALTDKDGHRYARIMNTVEGNPLTLTIQAGKKHQCRARRLRGRQRHRLGLPHALPARPEPRL